MNKLLSLVVGAVLLAGCGGTLCDRINSSSDTFFAGKTECKYTDGTTTLTITKKTTCDVTNCTADDQKALDAYATCLGKAQPCTTGNEKKATADATACVFGNLTTISQACSSAQK